MTRRKPSDIDGTQRGWGVFRPSPWHFADLFSKRDHAEVEASERGPQYIVRYGELKTGTDSFDWDPKLQVNPDRNVP